MSRLILIKHALPDIDPALPAARWLLSDQSRRDAARLADRLQGYGLARIITSLEPKAVETGQIVARSLALPYEPLTGWHEHDRTGVPFFDTIEQFQQQVAHFFAHPNGCVFGHESAAAAQARIVQAAKVLHTRYPGQTIAVVTHGTVLTLYVQSLAEIEPYPFWQQLRLPSYVVIANGALEEVVSSI